MLLLLLQRSGGAAVSGGAGGGVITLTASHLLELDGTLDASATDAATVGCGAGAGGSVVVTAAHIAGQYGQRDLCFVCSLELRAVSQKNTILYIFGSELLLTVS